MDWEDNDDGIEGNFVSTDARYAIAMDSIYGYYTVHEVGNETESIGESMSLAEAKAIAQRHSDGLVPA